MSAFAKASASRKVASLLGGLAMLGTSALVLSGCAAGAGGAGGPVGDLTLKIGTALPQTGSLAFLGPPEEAGVALAIKDINEAAKETKASKKAARERRIAELVARNKEYAK